MREVFVLCGWELRSAHTMVIVVATGGGVGVAVDVGVGGAEIVSTRVADVLALDAPSPV